MFKSKSNHFNPSTLTIGAMAGCGLAVAVLAGSFSQAAQTPDENEKMALGTYQPQLAFQQYHGMQEFNQRLQEMQRQLQEAQQQGDQQRTMELQQQMQQLQGQVVEQFYADVEEVVPDVAEDAGVELVALEIVYAGDRFDEPKDITDELISKVNEAAGAGAGAGSERQPDHPNGSDHPR